MRWRREPLKSCPAWKSARRGSSAAQRPNALLGGEREGKRINGFDFGNSPAEYTPERVAGRTVIFTTTNGTRALHRCLGAGRVLIGAFVNLSTVCRLLRDEPRVDLVCSGTGGEISRDDALVAGAIADRLMAEQSSPIYDLNDQARLCREAWRAVTSGEPASAVIAAALKDTQGGRNLIAIGQDGDLKSAAEFDRFDIVPELDRPNWRIRLP